MCTKKAKLMQKTSAKVKCLINLTANSVFLCDSVIEEQSRDYLMLSIFIMLHQSIAVSLSKNNHLDTLKRQRVG